MEPERMIAVWWIGAYAVLGTGLRGAFRHANDTFRNLYAIAFPIHHVIFAVLSSRAAGSFFTCWYVWAFVIVAVLWAALETLL